MRTGTKTAVLSLAGVFSGWCSSYRRGRSTSGRRGVFIGVYAAATAGPTIYLVVSDPAAIERRMKVGQATRPVQKVLIVLAFLLMPALMSFCALDHRSGWSPVPLVATLIGDALVTGGLVEQDRTHCFARNSHIRSAAVAAPSIVRMACASSSAWRR
ncbi:hypothetical protein GCM10009682_28240 [Luedemannella flava]|uniref:Uncharacterized protein n=1 Tax=Luedemannella flava TaxID=349316 RepID=A0ABP4Y5Y0_9ACTN